jgi:hypothetical protein
MKAKKSYINDTENSSFMCLKKGLVPVIQNYSETIAIKPPVEKEPPTL